METIARRCFSGKVKQCAINTRWKTLQKFWCDAMIVHTNKFEYRKLIKKREFRDCLVRLCLCKLQFPAHIRNSILYFFRLAEYDYDACVMSYKIQARHRFKFGRNFDFVRNVRVLDHKHTLRDVYATLNEIVVHFVYENPYWTLPLFSEPNLPLCLLQMPYNDFLVLIDGVRTKEHKFMCEFAFIIPADLYLDACHSRFRSVDWEIDDEHIFQLIEPNPL